MEYLQELTGLFTKIEAEDKKQQAITLDGAVKGIVNLIAKPDRKGNKIFLIGNGGSASIASHIATDFLKNASIPAMAFNDASLITCLSNDLGYEHVFRKPLELISHRGDILFSISSSGRSKNILDAASAASEKGCFTVTLSGFDSNNPLRKLGDINFYVPSYSYGHVEISHLSLCHCIVDSLIEFQKNG